jgi:hypothetical protein
LNVHSNRVVDDNPESDFANRNFKIGSDD